MAPAPCRPSVIHEADGDSKEARPRRWRERQDGLEDRSRARCSWPRDRGPMSELLARMADFDLTPDQREIRRSVRAFAEREVLPHVERYEKEGRYPTELVQKLGPLGLLGPL